jgi:hypothetical protein
MIKLTAGAILVQGALQIDRVRRLMWLSQDRDPLTPQEIEMLEDLIAAEPQTDAYLADAVSVARWVDAEG